MGISVSRGCGWGGLGLGPHEVFPSLRNFSRLVARSRELQNRSYIEESFTLLMVAMESLLVEGESISRTLSRRAGAILAISQSKNFDAAVKSVLKLYDARSKFVHQGEAITSESLRTLQEVCRAVFFAAYRSQVRSTRQTDHADNVWRTKWANVLDYVSACFDAGLTVDSAAMNASGAPMRNHLLGQQDHS